MVIGLSMATMAVLFAWRKMHRERVVVQPAMRPTWARPGRKPIALGEKPALWNMWTRREEEVAIDLKWESITVRQAPQSVSNITLIRYWLAGG